VSALNVQTVFSGVSGRLVIAPTNVGMAAGVYPWGSSSPLGFVTRAQLIRARKNAYANGEAMGRDKRSTYTGRESVVFACVFEQWDETLNRLLWAYSTTSPNGYSGANILSIPRPGGNVAPGLVTAQSPILFGADDPTMPSLLMMAPSVTFDEKLVNDLRLNAPLENAAIFVCGGEAEGVRYDRMENLSTS